MFGKTREKKNFVQNFFLLEQLLNIFTSKSAEKHFKNNFFNMINKLFSKKAKKKFLQIYFFIRIASIRFYKKTLKKFLKNNFFNMLS